MDTKPRCLELEIDSMKTKQMLVASCVCIKVQFCLRKLMAATMKQKYIDGHTYLDAFSNKIQLSMEE